MVSSIAFSAFLALSLTPALCATLLKPVEAGHHHAKTGFFGWFNRGFSSTAKGYEGLVARLLRRAPRTLILYAVIIGAAARGVPAPAHVVPAQRRPGHHAGERAAAAGRHAGAHPRGDGAGRRLHAQAARSAEHGRRAGLQLFGPGPERRAGFRHAEGLGRAQRPRQFGRARGRPRLRCADGHPRCLHLPAQPAADSGTGHGLGLQLPPAGPRRATGHDALLAARNQMLGMAIAEQGADPGAPRRPGRRAAAATGHRPRQGQRAGRGLRRHQQRDFHRAGLELRERLPQRRAACSAWWCRPTRRRACSPRTCCA